MITATTFRLDQRLALVAGSSSGISLALNGRDLAKLASTAARLRAEGLTVIRRAFDVTDAGASDAGRFVNGHILYVDGGVTSTL